MLITDNIAAHLLMPVDFYRIPTGSWVFVWRFGSKFLDGTCRPEQVVRNKNGQIKTKSGRTFCCSDGYGSDHNKGSRKFRITPYTDDLRGLLGALKESASIMRKIGRMDFLSMPVTLNEATALRDLVESYRRRNAEDREGLHHGRVVRSVMSGRMKPRSPKPITCWFYANPPGFTDTLLHLVRLPGVYRLMQTEHGDWYQSFGDGGFKHITLPPSKQVAVERAATCGRLIKTESVCSTGVD